VCAQFRYSAQYEVHTLVRLEPTQVQKRRIAGTRSRRRRLTIETDPVVNHRDVFVPQSVPAKVFGRALRHGLDWHSTIGEAEGLLQHPCHAGHRERGRSKRGTPEQVVCDENDRERRPRGHIEGDFIEVLDYDIERTRREHPPKVQWCPKGERIAAANSVDLDAVLRFARFATWLPRRE